MLPDFLTLQKVMLNHSGVSSLNFGIFIFILLGIYTFIYRCENRGKPSIHSPDSILVALADREGKEGRRAASFTILASYVHSFDFMKLETRLTTQPAS